MNYRHAYHAGNFADVFKHTLVLSLLDALHSKEKPFCYFETHAGRGHYDLKSVNAQKTREFKDGIEKLYSSDSHRLHPVIAAYLKQIKTWNEKHTSSALRYYPGSPILARSCLRPQDRMILSELHPQEANLLKECFSRDTAVAIHHLDGYQALKAFLPPPIRRGLVLIDPPFEKTDEFRTILDQLPLALQRFPMGIYAIWYPIKDTNAVKRFYHKLKSVPGVTDWMRCEMYMNSQCEDEKKLDACGLVVIHPPWEWYKQAEAILMGVSKLLSPVAHYSMTLE